MILPIGAEVADRFRAEYGNCKVASSLAIQNSSASVPSGSWGPVLIRNCGDCTEITGNSRKRTGYISFLQSSQFISVHM